MVNLMIEQKIEDYNNLLKNLLDATPIKYSSWSQEICRSLSETVGVYHFFERNGDSTSSLYVGKAGFGGGGWSLCKRLNQHFLPSQKNTLIGKIAKSTGENPQVVKASLSKRDVYLQWIIINQNNTQFDDIEMELVWIECFCKSILKPKYTNS